MIAAGLLAAFGLLLPAPAAAESRQAHFVIVGGLGGEPAYQQRFGEQVSKLEEICRQIARDDSRVHVLSGNAATRSGVRALLERLGGEIRSNDALALFLIGHGTYDGHDYKFNLPGPDITGAQLKELLGGIPAEHQLVVNTTGASGASIDLLKGGNRIVIAATKSGRERNAPVFAQYWLEALEDPAADTDKSETISALEAFRYAEQKVKDFYRRQKRLASEHPRLEGELAASFTLARLGSTLEASGRPETRELMARREELEGRIDQLRAKKSSMDAEEYEHRLETLLVSLARLQAEIDTVLEQR